MSKPLPYADSYWVIPGKLTAGEYPGVRDELIARKRIQSLLKCGVSVFLDLTQPGDTFHPYAGILREEAEDFQKETIWISHPINDLSTPSIQGMNQILDEIDSSIQSGKVVYVHCLAGIGRTGTVVGCYLIRHGLKPQEAIETIAKLRKDTPAWWQRSPEMDEQQVFILNWTNGQ